MIRKGIAAARGKALAEAMLIETVPLPDLCKKRTGSVDDEFDKVSSAISSIDKQMQVQEKILGDQEEALSLEIIQMQRTMLLDQVFHENIKQEIEKGFAADSAVFHCIEQQCEIMENLGDEYLAARAEDFRDVGTRVVCHILGKKYPAINNLEKNVILVGENIPPSLLAGGDVEKIQGILLSKGSKTAHVCILASNMGIPAVVGCSGIEDIKNEEMLFLDGIAGEVSWDMDQDTLQKAEADTVQYQEKQRILQKYTNKKGMTCDGVPVQVLANIMDAEAAVKALECGAEGVGLFRTEFLYMGTRKLPAEEEQFLVYKEAAETMKERPLVIRTMDIGGDKEAEALQLPEEENPFLGYRAIRICLDRKELFVTQIKAILRAGIYGNIQIMFPMISCMEELEQALACVEQAKNQLDKEQMQYNAHIPVGMMVEVPSVAVMASAFIKKVDFFSIGSNDLTQYTLAVDRQNENIASLYDYFDPAVLTLISGTIEACKNEGKECSVCGEMAADPLAVPVLLGMGLKKFSVNPSMVPLVKHLLSVVRFEDFQALSRKLLSTGERTQIKKEIRSILSEEYQSWL